MVQALGISYGNKSSSLPPGTLGRRLVSSKNHLLIAPVHTFTKFVHSACTGTHLCHLFSTANQKASSKTIVHKITV